MSPRTGTSSSASNESSWRPNALRSTVTSRSGRIGGSPPAISVGQHDHPGARPEDRRAAVGEVEDRLAQAPALDELAHRRALAAGQDQPADAVEVGRLAHADALDADRARACRGARGTPPAGRARRSSWRGSPAASSVAYQPRTARRSWSGISSRAMPAHRGAQALARPRRSSSGRRRTSSPGRSRWPSGPDPRS